MNKILSEKNDEGKSLFNIFVKKEFKIHASNIKELINSNTKKTNKHLENLSSNIVALTANLEFTQRMTRNYSR